MNIIIVILLAVHFAKSDINDIRRYCNSRFDLEKATLSVNQYRDVIEDINKTKKYNDETHLEYLNCFSKFEKENFPIDAYSDFIQTWYMYTGSISSIVYNTLQSLKVNLEKYTKYELIYKLYISLYRIYNNDDLVRMLKIRDFNYYSHEKVYKTETVELLDKNCYGQKVNIHWDNKVPIGAFESTKANLLSAKKKIDQFFEKTHLDASCRKFKVDVYITGSRDEYNDMLLKYNLKGSTLGVTHYNYTDIVVCIYADDYTLPQPKTNVHEFYHMFSTLFNIQSYMEEGMARFMEFDDHNRGCMIYINDKLPPRYFDYNDVYTFSKCKSFSCRYTWSSLYVFYLYKNNPIALGKALSMISAVQVDSDDVHKFINNYHKNCKQMRKLVFEKYTAQEMYDVYYPPHLKGSCRIAVDTNKGIYTIDDKTHEIENIEPEKYYNMIISHFMSRSNLIDTWDHDNRITINSVGCHNDDRILTARDVSYIYNQKKYGIRFEKLYDFRAPKIIRYYYDNTSSVDFNNLIREFSKSSDALDICNRLSAYIEIEKYNKANLLKQLESKLSYLDDNIFHLLALNDISVDYVSLFDSLYKNNNKNNKSPVDYGLKFDMSGFYCDSFLTLTDVIDNEPTLKPDKTASAPPSNAYSPIEKITNVESSPIEKNKSKNVVLSYSPIKKFHIVKMSQQQTILYDFVKIIGRSTITFKLNIDLSKNEKKQITFEITI